MELLRPERRDEAIALLLPVFRRKVFGLAYSFLRDREAAEDVTQEVFIKVWRALPGFDGRASLSTWIYTIARNTSLSALRARRPQASLSDPEVMEAVEAIDPATSADIMADRAAVVPARRSAPHQATAGYHALLHGSSIPPGGRCHAGDARWYSENVIASRARPS